jgi:hypothetical protein
MSLINDALRQASQEQKAQEAPPLLDPFEGIKPPPLEPLEPLAVSPWSSLLPVILVGVVVLGVLGVGGWLAWKTWNSKRAHVVAQARSLTPEAPPAAAGAASTNLPGATAPSPAPQAAPAAPPPTAPRGPRTAVAPATAPSPPAAATAVHPAPPVKWPALKLQGIIFNPPNSSVFINNKMLYADDEIMGAKVGEIGRHTVMLVLDGHTNTLLLR